MAVQHRVDETPGRLCLIEGDVIGYWNLARHITRGEDFAVYDPPRYVHRMPGFPVILACGMKLFGENVLWIRMLLAVIGTGACGFVYWLGRVLVDRSTGLIACFLAAVSPSFIVFSVLLLSETVFAFALLASLIALAKLVQLDAQAPSGATPVRRNSLAIVAGLLCGAATLVRPTWILVAPGFAAAYLVAADNRRQRFMPAILIVASLALALTPWTIRNFRVTRHFIPTTLWVGASLYDGLSADATGDSDMRFIETDGLYAQRQAPDFEYEADRHYRRAAFDFVRAHPASAFVLAFTKLGRFFNPFPNAGQFGHWAIRWGVGLFELPVLLLAAVGFWQVRRAPWRWLLAAGPVLYFALVHSVFVGSVRYRLPAEYSLLVLTAIGCHWSARRLSCLIGRPAA